MRDLPLTPDQVEVQRGAVRALDASVQRVLSLPRREPLTPDQVELIAAAFRRHAVCPDPSAACLRCNGTGIITLRPIQAEVLRELYDTRGLFGQLGVGSGKTLITLLAATVLQARNPVLLIPAALREKTRRDFARYLLDWHVRLPKILSYEELGQPQNADRLIREAPDLLLLDEADHVRNLGAARSRRVNRAIDELGCLVVPVSGTLRTDKLMDSWHFATWSLRERAPLPLSRAEAERWAAVVDSDETALAGISDFSEHFRTRRGVVFSQKQDCEASILIEPWSPELPKGLRDLIDEVERSNMRPDGELLDEWELPACLCMLAQGFFQYWEPAPPRWWLIPRRAWWAYQRAVLDEELPDFDSAHQVVMALDNLRAVQPPAHREGAALLAAWRAVKDQYEPETTPVWVNRDPMRAVVDHVRSRPGTLVWIENVEPGLELQRLGLPYYGAGAEPETAPPGQTIVLSIPAHHRGANMQAWNRSLVLHPPASARRWEQLIGRTHRAFQRADHVYVEPYTVIDYHTKVLRRVLTEARRVSRKIGAQQKIVLADWATEV